MEAIMKILLTGSTGFIGSYFASHNPGYEIVPFSFQNGDISALDFSNIDAIVHLAALVHQMNGAPAEEYERINSIRTLELAQKAKDEGVGHFVLMSTVKVYGEESETAYTENSPCHPQDPYGQSKLNAENALLKLSEETFVISIVRSPLVYGKGVKGNIKSLISLVQSMPILPLGHIQNLRSMVYVGNLCCLLHAVLDQKLNGIFLAGDDIPLSTTQFIQLLANTLNRKLLLLHIPFFVNLLRWLSPTLHRRLHGSLYIDNTLTKNQLSFHNPYSVEEGVKIMLGDKSK